MYLNVFKTRVNRLLLVHACVYASAHQTCSCKRTRDGVTPEEEKERPIFLIHLCTVNTLSLQVESNTTVVSKQK